MTSHKSFDLYTGLPHLRRANLKESLSKKVVENPLVRIILSGIPGRRCGTTEKSVNTLRDSNGESRGRWSWGWRSVSYLAPTG
jgi:hypothetical protein